MSKISNVWYSIYFYDHDQSGADDVNVERRWCDGERRRNTDVPIDDPVISDVDKRVSVVWHEAGSTGSASDWHR